MEKQNIFQSLAEKISQQTHQTFNQFYKKKYKIQNIDINKKYTVISSISLVQTNSNNFEIICITNGTKSLPYQLYIQYKGILLKDTHAEILCIKAFRKWILNQLTKESSKYFDFNEKKQKMQFKMSEYKIFFYTSERFCGDCSIFEEKQLFSAAKPLKHFQTQQIPQQDKYEKYILRTKPGRLDLPLNKKSLCLCCSDKLALYNVLGIQGKQLFSYILPIYIDYFIVNNCQSNQRENIQKGLNFVARLAILKKQPESLIQRKIFNIIVDGKQRKISGQFFVQFPQFLFLDTLIHVKKQEKQGIEVSVILLKDGHMIDEWINSKTGLPQGSSLKTFSTKGKISKFCKTQLKKKLCLLKQKVDQQFKYSAIKDRIKQLFGTWTDSFKIGAQFKNDK